MMASKDYKRLKELLDEGRTIVVSLDLHTGKRYKNLASLDTDEIGQACYNLGAGLWSTIHYPDRFVQQCEGFDVEFEEPEPSMAENRAIEAYPVKFGLHYEPDIHYEVDLNRRSRKIFLDGYTLGAKDAKDTILAWLKERKEYYAKRELLKVVSDTVDIAYIEIIDKINSL